MIYQGIFGPHKGFQTLKFKEPSDFLDGIKEVVRPKMAFAKSI